MSVLAAWGAGTARRWCSRSCALTPLLLFLLSAVAKARLHGLQFYNSRDTYDRELAMYDDPKLREVLLPIVQASDNEDQSITGPHNFVFPPFAITERGEGLNEWMSRAAPDVATTVFVLLHVAERLQQLHEAGWCHRDLKPANVLWRPKSNAWALVDFGCAARIGARSELSAALGLPTLQLCARFLQPSMLIIHLADELCKRAGSEAPLVFTLHYAPPELLQAAEAGATAVRVETAPDLWGVGIIAWELLTGERVFEPGMDEGEIADVLAGRGKLPWERPEAAATLVPKLRNLKRSVLKCLARDPAERPSSRELLGSWNGLFESLTGTTRDAFVPHGSGGLSYMGGDTQTE